jgi:uncharacterized Ntn-hydrolase superfamily protein
LPSADPEEAMSRPPRSATLALAVATACAALAALPAPARAWHGPSTFSIVAFDSTTGELGVAVESKYFAVGRTVPWARAGIGAVATQANVNASYGPQALDLLAGGAAPEAVLRTLAAGDSAWGGRQLGIVDARGRTATWTGPTCSNWAGGGTGAAPGVSYACQGNILAGPAVVGDMARAFRDARGELAERLVTALEAAQAAGGDKRGQQSTALLVVRPSRTHPEYEERFVELHVEDHATPIAELRRLWSIHQGFHGAGAHMDMAAEYEADGRPALARAERERVHETLVAALARDEQDATLLNGLAWACAEHDLELPDALRAQVERFGGGKP